MGYAKCNIKKKWYMKYDDDKYSDIGAIVEHWGKTISLFLPTIHALTGCDTTSFFLSSWKSTYSEKAV